MTTLNEKLVTHWKHACARTHLKQLLTKFDAS